MGTLSEDELKELFKKESFWKELAPEFAITDTIFEEKHESFSYPDEILSAAAENLNEEGYFSLKSVLPKPVIKTLTDGIVKISSFNIHPIFTMLYDPYWTAFQQLSPILTKTLGNTWKLLPDFWVWNVPIGSDHSGWPVHRDMLQPFMDEDGNPTMLSLWISLTDATPLNSCIYLLPTHLDPLFPDELEEVIGFPFENVRALNAPPGTVLCWNVNAAHWGSRSTKHAAEPRISSAFYLQRGDMEPYYSPLISLEEKLPFERRLELVCINIFRYKGRNKFTPFLIDFSEAYLNK